MSSFQAWVGGKNCDFLCDSGKLIAGVDSSALPAWNANLFSQMSEWG